MTGTESTTSAVPRTASGLQVHLRRLFQLAPPHIAMRQSLALIGEHFHAIYASLHGVIAESPLSEEWAAVEFEAGEALRERVNESMLAVLEGASSRCLRLEVPSFDSGVSVIIAPMFDEELSVGGAASIIVPDADRDTALALLGRFEELIGFLGLLASTENEMALRMKVAATEAQHPSQVAAGSAATASADGAEDPWRAVWDLVAHVQQTYGLDQVSVGVVGRTSRAVTVKVVSGMSHVRAANPGVQRIRAAMEEALDRDCTTVFAGRYRLEELGKPESDDPRLHRQWSDSVRGDPVATIVLRVDDVPVGVLALRHHKIDSLRLAKLTAIEEDARPWASLFPLVALASRGLARHALDRAQRTSQRLLGKGRRRALTAGLLLAGFIGGLAGIRVDDAIDAPSRLVPAEQHVVSAPHSGTLTAVHVRPGDPVQAGTLLAEFDLREEELAAEELRARCRALAADLDAARGEQDLAGARVAEARLDAARQELALTETHLTSRELRASHAGTVLETDLRHRIGDRIALGERLFEIAVGDALRVEIEVPDADLPEQDRIRSADAVFVPFSDPSKEFALDDCRPAPTASLVNGRSVFVIKAGVAGTATGLRPGMEGSARLRVGTVSLWTATTRPLSRWLHRRGWL